MSTSWWPSSAWPGRPRTGLAWRSPRIWPRETVNQLRRQLQPGAGQDLRIEVRGPGDPGIGRVRGATQLERQQAAEALGRRVNAHVVVYGELDTATASTSLRPEFSFSSDLVLRGAEELVDAQAGELRLGAPIERPGDVAVNQLVYADLQRELAARVKVLADVAAGLVFLNNSDRAAEAAPFLEAAETVEGWDDHEGREVLYLLLGGTPGRRPEEARRRRRPGPPGGPGRTSAAGRCHYRHALRIDPQYARGQLGLAETAFLLGQRGCQPGRADPAGLEEAVERFHGRRAAGQPAPHRRCWPQGRVRAGPGLCLPYRRRRRPRAVGPPGARGRAA